MTVYISATIISMAFAFIAVHYCNRNAYSIGLLNGEDCIISQKSKRKPAFYIFAFLSFCPLFIVSAIRYNVGTDYSNIYAPMFEAVAKGRTTINVEFGYYLLNRLTLLVTSDYVGIFAVTSFLFAYFMYKAIYQQSANVAYSILLLLITSCFFFSMNGVRQAITISMFMYALKFIKKRQFIRYIVIIALAATIHLSAVIFIPFYFIYNIRIKPLTAFVILGSEVVLLPVVKLIAFVLIKYTRYSRYIDTKYTEGKFDYSNFVISIALLVFVYLFYNYAKDNQDYMILANGQFISCCFLIMTYQISILTRFAVSYKYLGILYLPLLTSSKYIKDTALRYAVNILIVCLYFAYMFISIGIKGFGEVLPYQTILAR